MTIATMLAGAAIIVSGWWGRYELPVGIAVAAGVVFSFGAATDFPAFHPLGVGLLLAWSRYSIVRESGGNKRGDVGKVATWEAAD